MLEEAATKLNLSPVLHEFPTNACADQVTLEQFATAVTFIVNTNGGSPGLTPVMPEHLTCVEPLTFSVKQLPLDPLTLPIVNGVPAGSVRIVELIVELLDGGLVLKNRACMGVGPPGGTSAGDIMTEKFFVTGAAAKPESDKITNVNASKLRITLRKLFIAWTPSKQCDSQNTGPVNRPGGGTLIQPRSR